MSFTDFEIRMIDDELADIIAQTAANTSAYAINRNIRFNQQRSLSTPSGDTCFININDETRKVGEDFRESVKGALGSPIGEYSIKNCYLLGQPGIIVDPDHQCCWLGYSLGWNLDMLKNSLLRNRLGQVIDGKILRLNDAVLNSCKKCSIKKAHLLSLPGYAVFGHWIIDIAPRLQYLKDNPLSQQSSICAPPPTSWGREIANMFGINLDTMLPLREREGIHVHELTLSSCNKSNRIIDHHSAKRAWRTMLQAHAGKNRTKTPGISKLYVSRSKLENPRKFLNGAEIDAFFNSSGWRVIHPEALSLDEQANAFSGASIIAGDDGSALHNSIYSRAGTKLLCLDFHRANLLHSSIANVLDHKIAYVNGCQSTDCDGSMGWKMPLDRLSEAVSLMEKS